MKFAGRFKHDPQFDEMLARMIRGLRIAMEELKLAGCRTIYINGSFVTRKQDPKDFDCCWDPEDVDLDYLAINAPRLLNYFDRQAEKAKYKGEIFRSDLLGIMV